MALKLIRKNNQTEVTAYDDATIFHLAKGHDVLTLKNGGIFKGVYNSFGYILDRVNKKFILKSGMGMLYGRQFELPDNDTMEFSLATATSNSFTTIYVEINTTTNPETIEIKSITSNTGIASLGNTDIYKYKKGIARMPLYTIRITGGLVFSVSKVAYIYEPGVAERARALDGDATINGQKVSDLVDPTQGTVYVYHSRHALQADRATSLGNTSANINNIDNELYMPKRGSYLLQAMYFKVKADASEEWQKKSVHTFNLTNPKGVVVGYLFNVNTNYQSNPSKVYMGSNGGTIERDGGPVTIAVTNNGSQTKLTLTVADLYRVDSFNGTIDLYVLCFGGK